MSNDLEYDVLGDINRYCSGGLPSFKLPNTLDNCTNDANIDEDAILEKLNRTRPPSRKKQPTQAVPKKQKSPPPVNPPGRSKSKKQKETVSPVQPPVTSEVENTTERSRRRSNRTTRNTRERNRDPNRTDSSSNTGSRQHIQLPNYSTSRRSQRGRARRNYMSEMALNCPVVDSIDLASSPIINEIAARCPVLDTIDLVSSPLVPVTGEINLDSDEEKKIESPEPKLNNDINLSFDTENPDLRIKIKWIGEIQVYPLKKHNKFKNIIEKLAEKHNVENNEVRLTLDDRIIEEADTPDSINYNIYQFITGRIIKNAKNIKLKKKDPDSIEFIIQMDGLKKKINETIKKTDCFKVLYIKCADTLNVTIDKIKLRLDGEPLEFSETPQDQDLVGGELIDCILKK